MTSKTTADILRERQRTARNGAAPKDRRAADEGGYPGDHVEPIAPEAARQQEQGDAWEPASPEAAAKAAAAIDRSYRLAAVDSRTFFTTPYKLEWLVKRLLIKGQPCIFGGPKKSLKTTELVDLAVSLATATPFLGYFEVYRRCRVVMISGESGEAVLQETGRRICAARGIDPATLDVHWSFRLPKVASVLDRDALALGLQQLGAGVVIIDPLYLCLLAGMDARDVEAGNLFHMGPLLLDLARACLDAGATPALSHHARKNRVNDSGPMDLDDLSFAGIAEFARQWLLVSRRKPFDPETGSSKLWLSAGGSAGQSGLWAVDVEEGVLGDDFTGHKWEVEVRTATEDRESTEEAREDDRDRKRREQVKGDGTAVLTALDRLADDSGEAGYTKVRDAAGLPTPHMVRAVLDLTENGVVEEVEMLIATGRNLKVRKATKGLRRPHRATDGTDGTSAVFPVSPVSE